MGEVRTGRSSARTRTWSFGSLELQTLALALLLVLVSIGACGVLLARAFRVQLEAELIADVTSAGDRFAAAVGPYLAVGDREGADAALDESFDRLPVAFVVVKDASGRELTARASDASLWLRYRGRLSGTGGDDIETSGPASITRVEREGRLVGLMARQAVWTTTPSRQRKVVGFLELCISDAARVHTLEQLTGTALMATAAVALVATPVTVLGVRVLARPVRLAAAAAQVLARGEQHTPLPEGGPAELANLGRAFNSMALQLADTMRQLESANRDLEAQVRARTGELERVNRLLRLEIEEKDRFLRAISHDLSAPLRNIAGMATMIIRRHGQAAPEPIHPDALERVERILANVQRQTDMLGDLMELSRLSGPEVVDGGAVPDAPAVSLASLAQDIAALFEHDCRSRGIALRIDPGLPSVRIAQRRVRLVLHNLLDNAIKYLDDAPGHEVRVASVAQPDGSVQVRVADTGPGVQPDEREQIFEVFRRGTAAGGGGAASGGKGLGLAMVKAVVTRWGGRVWIEDTIPSTAGQPGRGATFVFTIPAEAVVGAAVSAAPLPPRPERVFSVSRGPDG